MHHCVGDLKVINRTCDVHQGGVGRIGIGPLPAGADQGFIATDAIEVLRRDATAGGYVDRRACAIGANGYDHDFRCVVDVVDAETDVGHILGEIKLVGRAFSVFVGKRCQRAVGVGRLGIAGDRMDLLLVGRECCFRCFVRIGDRECDIYVAGVLGEAAGQVVVVINGGAVAWIGSLVPFKAFAHGFAGWRGGTCGVVVPINGVIARAASDGVIAVVAFDIVGAGAPFDGVVAAFAKDGVIAGIAHDDVVAALVTGTDFAC